MLIDHPISTKSNTRQGHMLNWVFGNESSSTTSKQLPSERFSVADIKATKAVDDSPASAIIGLSAFADLQRYFVSPDQDTLAQDLDDSITPPVSRFLTLRFRRGRGIRISCQKSQMTIQKVAPELSRFCTCTSRRKSGPSALHFWVCCQRSIFSS